MEDDNWNDVAFLYNKFVNRPTGKSAGHDQIPFDFLKSLPYHGFVDITNFFRKCEENMTWPKQMLLAIIALIDKDERSERPIAILSTLYRVWCIFR